MTTELRPPRSWIGCRSKTEIGVTCQYRARYWLRWGGSKSQARPVCGIHAKGWGPVDGAKLWLQLTDNPAWDERHQ